MAASETEITKEELQKEIADILDNASLDKTSTKKVIQKLEKKLGVDLTEKKKMIDQLVMDYVNSMDSEDEDSAEEEPPVKVAPKKAKIWKKQDDDEDDEEHDDSNDSDWGCRDGHLLDGDSTDESYRPLPQEPTITTSSIRHGPNCPRNGVILKRVAPPAHEEDEADIFGKLTAKKLRKLSDEQRDSMMIEINQLFYDISYKRDEQSHPPKPRMVDKFTSMPPTIQFEAKKIYRVNNIPSHLMSPSNLVASGIPIALATKPKPAVTSTRVPKTVVPPSNVPEPVVQEAATPKPVVAPANEKASENNGGLFCDL